MTQEENGVRFISFAELDAAIDVFEHHGWIDEAKAELLRAKLDEEMIRVRRELDGTMDKLMRHPMPPTGQA
jgi:hypothetical protein